MENEFDHNKIEDYVNGKLDSSSAEAFEAELAKDEDLAKEVAFYKDLRVVAEVAGEEDFQKMTNEVVAELETEGFFAANAQKQEEAKKETARPKLRVLRAESRKWLALAASILVLISVGTGWWANANYSDSSIAGRQFDAEIAASANRSKQGTDDVFAEGLTALSNGNYEQAASFFATFPSDSESYEEARLYLTIAQFQSNNFTESIANAELVANTSTRFREKARWLQLNAMLASGQKGDEFENLLNEIATQSPDNFYRNKAKNLQKELTGFWRYFVL